MQFPDCGILSGYHQIDIGMHWMRWMFVSRDSRCTELGGVTESGRHTALAVCNGVDQTLIDLSSLTGHVDHTEPLTRPLYTSNTSGPLTITLTTPTYDDVAYLLRYEGLITEIRCYKRS